MTLTQQDYSDIETLIKRPPSKVEEHIFDTMWSEHCSYKSSKHILKRLPTKGSEVALGIGEDSGIIRFAKHNGKQYCLAISHESHNHPSQVLPIEGAATGVGGVVRDVYCMGADVIGVLDSLHFGVSEEGETSLVDEIAEKVVLGVSDYGNSLGVPVLGGETIYHPSYNDNCLVNVAALGLVEESKIIHSYTPKQAADEPYDVILFGKSTDATGFGGASFSSATLDTDDQQSNIGAVQVHDPFIKRVLVEAIKVLLQRVDEQKIEIGFKDLGAGGISCATSEIAASGGFGVTIDLNKVNVAMDGLLPEVIACSETQERFCLTVPRHFSQTVLDIFNKEFELPRLYPNAGAAVIGEVVKEPVYKIMYNQETVCELPVNAITTDVKADRTAEPKLKTTGLDPNPQLKTNLKEMCLNLIKDKFNVSKRFIYRFYDNAVRGDTIIYPGEADAVVVAPIKGCQAAVAVSMDSNIYGLDDAYVSGAAAVAESVRNVIAVGARPIAITDCLNYGNPEKPPVFHDFEQGVQGIADAAQQLGFIENEALPIISGNVSFYNESTQGTAVVPSPVILCAGKIESYYKVITMQIEKPNQTLILIGKRYQELASTQVARYLDSTCRIAPQVRLDDEGRANKFVYDLIQDRLLSACHDISAGGLWQCVVEMVLGERGLDKVGVQLNLSDDADLITWLFSENGGYVLSVDESNLEAVKQRLTKQEIESWVIGETTSNKNIVISQGNDKRLTIDTKTLESAWNRQNG